MSCINCNTVSLIFIVFLTGCGSSGGGAGGAERPVAPPAPPPPASVPPANRPPTISGTPPASVRANEAYDFRPTAVDPDGDVVGYSIQSQPAWANFEATSGRLSGTPDRTSVGRYDGIVISATDGRASAQIGPFTVEVTPPLGSANLSWSAPTTNVDGTPLHNLAAFIIYYGQSPLSLDRFVAVSDPRSTSYAVGGLSEAIWYFAVTSYTAEGVESDRSVTVSHSVLID